LADTAAIGGRPELTRLKLFLALSRTPHGVLDLAAPALAAVLGHGGIPPLRLVLLGFVTALAGYTAVYALNDVMDYRADREKFRAGFIAPAGDLDGLFVRHPMAQGFLSFREGILWVVAWAGVALIGAYLLNPVCAKIFLFAAALEAVYCLLLRVHPLRTLVSGVVKTSGGIAAVYAVDPDPSPALLLALFLWLFLWEVGGQNVPNDWADLEEDRRLGARTVPIFLGLETAGRGILATLATSVALGPLLLWLSPVRPSLSGAAGTVAVGLGLLVLPALRLRRSRLPADASALFNRASYYPLAVLAIVALDVIL
jgi:4-hydroxybenzoate polyprenyltransferase